MTRLRKNKAQVRLGTQSTLPPPPAEAAAGRGGADKLMLLPANLAARQAVATVILTCGVSTPYIVQQYEPVLVH